MAALAVVSCQPCVFPSAQLRRLPGSRSSSAARLSWDPLNSRSSLFSIMEGGIASSCRGRRAELRARVEEGNEERKSEAIEKSKGFVANLLETVKSSVSTAAVKPALVACLAGFLLLAPVEMDDAMAASSGGRMGGRVFKSAPAPSRSYSGGGGGGGGRSYSAPPIYGSPYGYGGFSPFSPFGGGYGYGGGLLLGPSIGFGGGGFFLFSMIAFVTLRAIAGFLRNRFDNRDDFDD